jgi:hypothetical protein
MTATVAGEHELRQTLTIDVYAPDHPDRSTSPIFRHTRKKLIEDNPAACCWICDKTEAQLGEPLELHHELVEWCDSLAVSWAVVQLLAPAFDWSTFDPAHPEMFIDSEQNARLVLCKKHHTGKDHGIHMLPYSLWILQKTKRQDFIFSPDEIRPTQA